MFSFHTSFGKALMFEWFGDNKLVIGFNTGYFSCVSTKSQELGQEIFSVQALNGPVESLCVNFGLGKIGIASQGVIKFWDSADWKECPAEKIEIEKSCGRIT